MLRPRYAHLHFAIAIAWLGLAVWLGIGTALLGNEEAVLAKQRGRDRKIRNDLVYQNDRLRDAIDHAASAPVLGAAVKKLGLPLQAPAALAKAE